MQDEKQKPVLTPLETVRAQLDSRALSEDQLTRVKNLREAAKFYAEEVLNNTKSGADQTAALRKIREANMTLVAHISMEEVGK